MNKLFLIIIIIIIAAGGYFFLKRAPVQTTPAAQTPTPEQTAPAQSSAEKESAAEEKTVTYTDNGYSPSTLEINAGDTVVFKNGSSQSMWPASAMHPAHKDYPTIGGCLGSTFDACKGVQPGDSWPFQFDIAGNWKYHDHLNPKNFGAIIVQQ